LGLQIIDVLRDPSLRQPPPKYTPSVSVVICTREHPDQLQRQLESCSKLIYANFEIIAVDNAPVTNRTRRVCERFPLVRYIVEPRKGLDYARNTGWRAARNEIVAYSDDDAIVDPLWLAGLGSAYIDPRVTCVTGITFPMEVENRAQELFEKYGGMHKGFVRRVYRPGTWNAFYPLGSGRFGAGVNMSLRRETLEQMGGFDEALDVGSLARGGGDLDIMARAIRDGGTLVYEPCAIAWHQHRRTMKQLRKQMFDYGYGFTAYAAKYATDLELGNLSARMVRRWANIWGKKRFKQNLKLALQMKPHFPLHLILLEIAGGLMGAGAYRRSLRTVRSAACAQQLRMAQEEAA
jgi:glycosyltransferase involved in cell wall biosynthesis